MKKTKSQKAFYMKPAFFIALALIAAFMGAYVIQLTGVLSGNKKPEKSKNVQIEVPFVKHGEVRIFNGDEMLYEGDVEIADNELTTTQGLMYRSSMDKNQGMYFVFPDMEMRSFWMRNTRIPLDIIYIDSEGNIVSIVHEASPYDETSRPSEGPAMYVLELLGGVAAENGIEKGDRVELNRM